MVAHQTERLRGHVWCPINHDWAIWYDQFQIGNTCMVNSLGPSDIYLRKNGSKIFFVWSNELLHPIPTPIGLSGICSCVTTNQLTQFINLPSCRYIGPLFGNIIMPPPLVAGGIRIPGCPSTLPSTHPSRGFRVFSRKPMEVKAWNLVCWCILSTFRNE